MWKTRWAVAGGAVILLVLVGAAALASGSGPVPGGTGLVIDGSVFGEKTPDGMVSVPGGKVTSANESVVIQNEDKDLCIGNCPGSESGGGEP